jgi:2-polyprenyl-3-methyl-5-hydroxy-6-metoxy-1,4-benzoquinol methylase
MMKRSPLTHRRVFSDIEYAREYANQHKGMAEKFGKEYAKKLSVRGFQRGRIIDVGCGSGGTNQVLAESFIDSEIIGIDLSEPLLQLAREAIKNTPIDDRMRFEKADVQEISYDENTFDVVINTNMVHLVENPIRMLDEIERILVPGGHLFIADLRRSWLGFLESEIKSALTINEAKYLFNQSKLRKGTFRWDLLWWRFES